MMRKSKRVALLVTCLLIAPAVVGAVEVGQPAPAFSLPRVGSGAPVSLGSLRGQVVVIDFWASWCRPCIEAMPELDRLTRELGPRGLQVLAVSIDEEASAAEGALGSGSHAFTPLHDGDSAVAERYGVGGSLPATVVIDRQGRVRLFRAGGAVEPAELRRLVESLL